MGRMTRWVGVLLVGAVLVAGCGGDDKLSAEECAKEAAKLFDDVDDIGKISERFAELEDKGCTTPQGTTGGTGTGAPPTFDAGALEGADECLALSGEAAAKGVRALQATDDPAEMGRINEELEALNRRLREECPQFAS